VVSASTTTATANILIGRTGGDASYQRLASMLRDAGYVVTEHTASPIGAHSSSEDTSGLLDSVDMAFLVVRQADVTESTGPVQPFQRVARDVGIIQGKLGMDRVVLLVEDQVGGLSTDLGVSSLRMTPRGPEASADEILQRIRQVVPQRAPVAPPIVEPGIHDRLARIERSKADNEVIPFILFGVIALAALLGVLLIAVSLLGGGDDGGEEVAASGEGRARLIDVASSLRTTGSTATPSESGSSALDDVAGSIVSAEEVDEDGLPEPSGPSAAFGGTDQLFPATCQVDLVKASLLDSASDCAGAGVLVLNGSPGPWHNDVVAIALSDGVVGEVVYERTGAVEILDRGLVVLDPAEAAFGLGTMTVSFSAPGQHVHLLDSLDSGAREATLTLRLER
jgi:hypothetical protein